MTLNITLAFLLSELFLRGRKRNRKKRFSCWQNNPAHPPQSLSEVCAPLFLCSRARGRVRRTPRANRFFLPVQCPPKERAFAVQTVPLVSPSKVTERC